MASKIFVKGSIVKCNVPANGEVPSITAGHNFIGLVKKSWTTPFGNIVYVAFESSPEPVPGLAPTFAKDGIPLPEQWLELVSGPEAKAVGVTVGVPIAKDDVVTATKNGTTRTFTVLYLGNKFATVAEHRADGSIDREHPLDCVKIGDARTSLRWRLDETNGAELKATPKPATPAPATEPVAETPAEVETVVDAEPAVEPEPVAEAPAEEPVVDADEPQQPEPAVEKAPVKTGKGKK